MDKVRYQVAVFKDVPSKKSVAFTVFCVVAPMILTIWWINLPGLERGDVWLITGSSFLTGTSFLSLLHDLGLRKHHARALAAEAAKAHEEADAADDEDDDEYGTF